MRASDAERDVAVDELKEHFAAGRLSHDTFLHRMNAALDARHQADLPPLFADLPARRPRGWLSAGWAGSLADRVLSGFRRRDRVAGDPVPARRLTTRLPASSARSGGLSGRVGGRDDRRPAAGLPFPRGAETTFSIGRDRNCDLVIEDMTVSRVHARLERTGDGWLLADLGSTNGTRVNGWLVRDRVKVRAGDVVRFGETEYELADPDAA